MVHKTTRGPGSVVSFLLFIGFAATFRLMLMADPAEKSLGLTLGNLMQIVPKANWIGRRNTL